MDGLTDRRPRRRRISSWVVVVLAVVINFPLVNHLLTERSIARSGVDVDAVLVTPSRSGEGADADFGLAFRFDETIDPAQSLWTAAVDRATYQRAVQTQTVPVRVLPDRPSAFEIEGEVTTRFGWYVTGALNGVLVVGALVVRRLARRREPEPLLVQALEDVQQHVPGSGPRAAVEELGESTYLVTGEVTRIEPDAVVLDAGEHQVRVALGDHANRVAFQQSARVLTRLTE